jgi:hypothetical protein
MNDKAGITSTSNTSHEEMFLHFFSPSLTAESKESCTSLVACMPVEIFMRQGGWAEIVFRRALVLANNRDDVTIDNILSHPVGPIPVSMFHEDGTMRVSCKSSLWYDALFQPI